MSTRCEHSSGFTSNPTTDELSTKTAIRAALAELARRVVTLQWRDVPETARRQAIMVLGDDIAAMVAATEDPQMTSLQDSLIEPGGPSEATIIGRKGLYPSHNAAVANGIAASWAELDEGYRPRTCHAGLYVLPALIAEAEASGYSLEAVLRGLVGGYEVVTRVARAWNLPHSRLHPHAVFGTLGATAGVGLLRGLDPAEFVSATNAASTFAMVGPFSHAVEGALIRNAWAAVGAGIGLRLPAWARLGVGGGEDALFEVLTLGLGGQAQPGCLVQNLADPWAIVDGYHKLFACCQYSHAAVEASLRVREQLGALSAASVRSITVETHELALSLDNYQPRTSLAAKFSLPHIVATALLRGSANASDFTSEAIAEPEIARLRERVEIRRYEPVLAAPRDRPARLTVTLDTSVEATQEVLSARGGPDRPFSEDEILTKIDLLTHSTYPRLVAGLQGLLDGKVKVDTSWREFVAEMLT